MKRLLISLLACTLAMAACGGDDDDDTAPADTSTTVATTDETTTIPPSDPTEPAEVTEPVELTDSFRGVTADTIRIGVPYVDLEAIRDVVDLDHGDYAAAYQAVVDDINANGGVLGRQIEIVLGSFSPIDTAASDAVCVQLTEDEEVFMVIGLPIFDQVLCYVQDHQMAVIGGMMNNARLAAAEAPWFSYDGNADNNIASGTQSLIDAGEFDGVTLGVAAGFESEDTMNDIVLTMLEDAGIDVAETAILEDTGTDIAAGLANVAVVAERFQSSRVDTVLFVGQGITGFLTGIAPTEFRPHITNLDRDSFQAYTQTAGNDLSVIEGAVTTGAAELVFDDPALQECFDIVEAAQPGLDIQDTRGNADLPEPWVSAHTACAQFQLFVDIATAAGLDLTYDTFQAAGEALGDWQGPGDPLRHFSADTPDGDPPRFLFRWNGATGRFVED